jgi:hypothetical protein
VAVGRSTAIALALLYNNTASCHIYEWAESAILVWYPG